MAYIEVANNLDVDTKNYSVEHTLTPKMYMNLLYIIDFLYLEMFASNRRMELETN